MPLLNDVALSYTRIGERFAYNAADFTRPSPLSHWLQHMQRSSCRRSMCRLLNSSLSPMKRATAGIFI